MQLTILGISIGGLNDCAFTQSNRKTITANCQCCITFYGIRAISTQSSANFYLIRSRATRASIKSIFRTALLIGFNRSRRQTSTAQICQYGEIHWHISHRISLTIQQ